MKFEKNQEVLGLAKRFLYKFKYVESLLQLQKAG
jgi:hypothetical protein